MFEQDRLLMRLQQQVLAERAIQVCFLAGSYGRRTQDQYSDLDVVLVFASESEREKAFAGREAFVRAIMPYVPVKSYDAGRIRPFFHIALYGNGAKLDLIYETFGSLEPSPLYRDIHLIKDSDGWGEEFSNQARAATPWQPQYSISEKELAELDNRSWIMFMDIYRQLLRGDSDTPFPIYLELMDNTVPSLRRLLPAEEPARRALVSSHYDLDTRATIDHLRHLIDVYLEARQAVIRRHNLSFDPDSLFEDAIIRLVKHNP